ASVRPLEGAAQGAYGPRAAVDERDSPKGGQTIRAGSRRSDRQRGSDARQGARGSHLGVLFVPAARSAQNDLARSRQLAPRGLPPEVAWSDQCQLTARRTRTRNL